MPIYGIGKLADISISTSKVVASKAVASKVVASHGVRAKFIKLEKWRFCSRA